MSTTTPDLTEQTIIRQVNSASHVLGKVLANDESGYNRFALVIEENGTRVGVVYRVQTWIEDPTLLFRDNMSELDADYEYFRGAPIYKWEHLGNNFWMETF